MEDAKFKVLNPYTYMGVSKTIAATGSEIFLKAGIAPTAAGNTGNFFCPEFKFTMRGNGASDETKYMIEATYVLETRGERFMNTV